MRRGALLVNAKSRLGADWFEQVRTTLVAGGIDLAEATAFRDPRQMHREVSRHVKDGTPLVIVGGGDGTFGSIAYLFARKKTVLGVVPLGTGNSLARDLGIPVTVDGACDAILNGKIAQIDMGLVGKREFINVASVGVSTGIALGLNDASKKRFGKAVYIVSLLRALASVKPFRVKLEFPSAVEEFESLQVVVGNGRFHAGPFPVAPDASITGGWLSVYALASRRKSAFVKMALHLRGGKHVELDEVRAFRVRSGRLSTIGPQRVTVDGEICLRTPVDFAIAPHALRVSVPADFGEAD